MTTWTVEFFPFNALELGIVTVTGEADSGYPESRLYDRAISLFYRDTVSQSKAFALDQAASPNQIDFLAIERHNLSGVVFDWQFSNDNFSSDINDAVPQWSQADNNQIIKRLPSPVLRDFWRVYAWSTVDPEIGEIYMSRGFSFNCLRESNPYGGDVDQVQWNQSIGGVERGTKLGAKKRVRSYTFMLSDSEFADFETIVGYLDDYSKPFYFKDHSGAYYLARFDELPSIDFSHNVYTRVSIRIIEML